MLLEYKEESYCELCERRGVTTTEHHLIPREEGGKDKDTPTVRLCLPCHRQIHALYTNRVLGLRLNTIEKMRADERIARYLNWVRKQNPENIITIKNSRQRRMNR